MGVRFRPGADLRRLFWLRAEMVYHLCRKTVQFENRVASRMKAIYIFAVSIAASALAYLISRLVSGLTDRKVMVLAVAAVSLYGVFLFLMPENWILINLVVVSVAGIGGSGLGLLLKTRQSLVIFCIVASIVDIYSVAQGPTSAVVEDYKAGTSDLLRYLVISMPVDGSILPLVGIGDFLIISAVYFVLIRLKYDRLQLALVPLLGLLLAIIIGLQIGGIFAIPFIAATTIAYLHWQEFTRT